MESDKAPPNRQTWLGTLGPQSYGVDPTSDRLLTLNTTAVTTDAAGNLTAKPGLALTFDDWSRLRTAVTGATTTTYGVNGLNERVSKTDGTTARVYVYTSPGHLLGVYDGATGAALEELTYLGDRPTATVRSGTIYPIETDHLMAPLRVLDTSNATVWSWEDREPFGGTAPASVQPRSVRFSRFFSRHMLQCALSPHSRVSSWTSILTPLSKRQSCTVKRSRGWHWMGRTPMARRLRCGVSARGWIVDWKDNVDSITHAMVSGGHISFTTAEGKLARLVSKTAVDHCGEALSAFMKACPETSKSERKQLWADEAAVARALDEAAMDAQARARIQRSPAGRHP